MLVRCLCNKQNNTWLIGDMEFLFSSSTRHLTQPLRSLVRYRGELSKRNSISPRTHVLFYMTYGLKNQFRLIVISPARHDWLETMRFEYIFFFIIVSKRRYLSDASRSPVMSLFILRLKHKISALTASCCYWLPEKF